MQNSVDGAYGRWVSDNERVEKEWMMV